MSWQTHGTDSDLMQLIDGELHEQRSSELLLHVAQCERCSSRMIELERAALDFAGIRAELLKRRETTVERPHWGALAAMAACLALIASAGLWWSRPLVDQPLKPDARLTPGVTVAMSREQVCAVRDEDEVKFIPASIATAVFESYGIQSPRPRTYELDYLITPALGGATDSRNLWPQPYTGGVWNARVKDALEDYLRHEVCQGHMALPEAQAEIAKDWIGAYQKHFQTEKPLLAHAKFVKDRPWE